MVLWGFRSELPPKKMSPSRGARGKSERCKRVDFWEYESKDVLMIAGNTFA